MQIVAEHLKTFWKTQVLSELWDFPRKGSKGVKILLHPKIFCWKRKQHHYQNPIWLRSVQYWLCQVNSDMEHDWPLVTAWHWFVLAYYIWTFKRQILPCSEAVKHKYVLITWHPLTKTLHQPCMNIQYLNTVLQLCYVHYKCE